MRKVLIIFLSIFMMISCVACGSSSDSSNSDASQQTQTAQSNQTSSEDFEFDDSIDYIDLTQMNSTMIYSQVLNIVQEPEKYVGKKLKMNGKFTAFEDENDGNTYFACVIADATACCQQGLEFSLKNAEYPKDYPKIDSDIIVEGTIATYDYEGQKIPTLKDANLV